MVRFPHSMCVWNGRVRWPGKSMKVGICLFSSLLGCFAGEASIAELTRAAAPYETEFKRFELWVQRASTTVQLGTADEAAMEALFGPVRHRGSVLFAQVQFKGRRERVWALPEKATLSESVTWRAVRLAVADEPVRVATARVCPIKVPAWWRDGRGTGPCVLIASEYALSRTEKIRLTVAFEATSTP